MRTSTLLTALLTAPVLVVAGLAAPAAAAPPLACGAVLTADVTLSTDLTCPTGDGLVLTPGVTLDLGGHTLRGAGAGTGILLPPLGDVTVRHGTVAGWGSGIASEVPWDEPMGGVATVTGVTFEGNGSGIDASGRWGGSGKDHVVDRSTFTGNYSGVGGTYGGAEVSRSTFTGNSVALVFTTGGFVLEDSVVEGNETAAWCDESGCVVRRSRIVGNGTGIKTFSVGADVYDSVLQGNGVAITSSMAWAGNTIERNTFKDNGTAVDLGGSRGALTGNTFRGNDVAFTTVEGDEQWYPATLTGNRFVRNGDGVIAAAFTSLRGNVVSDNARWGINAPGATDLGGNRAWGNGNEPQCVGVVCRGRS